jgi:hypothetical protein
MVKSSAGATPASHRGLPLPISALSFCQLKVECLALSLVQFTFPSPRAALLLEIFALGKQRIRRSGQQSFPNFESSHRFPP